MATKDLKTIVFPGLNNVYKIPSGGGGGGGGETDTAHGKNYYDEDHNSEPQQNPQYVVGTVYLDGYVGDMIVSCKGSKANYITDPVIYFSDNTSQAGTWGTSKYSYTNSRQGRPITIPSGAEKFEFKYRIASGSGTLVDEVMVTAGTDVPDQFEAYKEYVVLVGSDYVDTDRLKELNNSFVYVMLDGDDTNDGLTPDTAFASIGKALSVSSKVMVQRGEYDESLRIKDQNNITLLPYDNDVNFDQDEPYREKIVINSASFVNCHNLRIEDFCVQDSTAQGFYLYACMNAYLLNCDAIDTGSNGFQADNTNIILDRCRAINCGNDGFNFHTYGQSVLRDCIAKDCYDDGCSHHNGCCGTVIGGMFTGCGKGAMTPAQGAVVNCYGLYLADSRFGFYVVSDQGTSERTYFNIVSCAFVNNTDCGISVAGGHTANAINCAFSGNTLDTGGGGTINVYNSVPVSP